MGLTTHRLTTHGRAAVWVTVVAIAGCGRGGSDAASERDSASGGARASQGTAGARVGAGPPACPKTGHWSACQVRSSLERAGMVVRDTTLKDLPSLVVAPLAYRLGSASVAVYLFADSAARARAAGGLDTITFVPPTRPLTMQSVATLIENDNLLALYYGKNEHQRERVSDALTAGAPQP